MTQLVHRTVPATIGVALLGAIFIRDGQSLTSSHASSASATSPSSTIPTPAASPSNRFADVTKAVTPAVVNITTVMVEKLSDERSMPEESHERMEEFFGGPFGPQGFRGPQGSDYPCGYHSSGQGSGVIASSDGYVLTNNHVIDSARDVTVTLPDKWEFKGKIVGADPKTDLAVVEIDGSSLSTVTWGDAPKLQVG